MATDAKQLILDWCSVPDDLRLAEERSEPDSEFVLVLASGGAEVIARLPSGRDRLVLTQDVDIADSAGSIERDLPQLEEQRPGPVTVSPVAGRVVISTWIVLDGLSKHSLLSALSDLSRTRGAVLRLAGAASGAGGAATAVVDQPAATPDSRDVEPQWAATTEPATPVGEAAPDQPTSTAPAAEEAATTAASGSGGAPWAAGASGWSGYQPSASQPAYAQQAGQGTGQGFGGQGYASPGSQPGALAQAGWTPGHKVPPQGMQAWAAPDPSGAVVATLGGHLPVQVVEMRGAWARVICSNGWTGWVDGRLLVAGP